MSKENYNILMSKIIIKSIDELNNLSDSVDTIVLDLPSYSSLDYSIFYRVNKNTKIVFSPSIDFSFSDIREMLRFEERLSTSSYICEIDLIKISQNKVINELTTKLKASSLSQLEKMLIVFNELSVQVSISIGFSKSTIIIKHIYDELGFESYLVKSISRSEGIISQYILLTYVNDEKYHVNGLYASNPNYISDNKFDFFLHQISFTDKSVSIFDNDNKFYFNFLDDITFLFDDPKYISTIVDCPTLLDIKSTILNKLFPINKSSDYFYKKAKAIYEKKISKAVPKLLKYLDKYKIDDGFIKRKCLEDFVEPGYSIYLLLTTSILFSAKHLNRKIEHYSIFAEGDIGFTNSRILVKQSCHNIKKDLNEYCSLDSNSPKAKEVINRIAKVLYINEIKKVYVNTKYINIYNKIDNSTFMDLFQNVREYLNLDIVSYQRAIEDAFFIKVNQEYNINKDRFVGNHFNNEFKSIEEIKNIEVDFLLQKSNLLIFLNFEKYEFNYIYRLIEFAKKLKRSGYLPVFSIKAEDRNFSDNDIASFIDYKQAFDKYGYELFFDGGYKDTYTLDELIKADKTLDRIINYLNESSLSPFEKYLYIYNHLTYRPYTDIDQEWVDEENNQHLPRDIISIINSGYIVCSGYSVLMHYLCKEVGIKCFMQNVNVAVNPCISFSLHQNNLIYIKDEKYDIDGLYYSDACWDSVETNLDARYAFCLVPLQDVMKISVVPYIMYKVAFLYGDYYRVNNLIELMCLDYLLNDEDDCYGDNLIKELYQDNPSFLINQDKKAKSMVDKKISWAFDELIRLFKEHNVPKDIYNHKDELVASCTSINFLLATLIANRIDIFNKRLEDLLNFYNNYIKEDKRINPALTKFMNSVHLYDNSDYEASINYIRDNLDYFFVSQVKDNVFALLTYSDIRDKRIPNYPYSKIGEVISQDKFKNALKVVFEAEGEDEENIEPRIIHRFILTKIVASRAYHLSAINTFVEKHDEKENLVYPDPKGKSVLINKMDDFYNIEGETKEIILDLDAYPLELVNSYAIICENIKTTICPRKEFTIAKIKEALEFEVELSNKNINTNVDFNNALESKEVNQFANRLIKSNYSPLEKLLITFDTFAMPSKYDDIANKCVIMIDNILYWLGIESYISRRIAYTHPNKDNYRLLIYIKDDKYMVDGVYESNPSYYYEDHKFDQFIYLLNYDKSYFTYNEMSKNRTGEYRYDELTFLNDESYYFRCIVDLPYAFNPKDSFLTEMFPDDKTWNDYVNEAISLFNKNGFASIDRIVNYLKERKIPNNFTSSRWLNHYSHPGYSLHLIIAASIIYDDDSLLPLLNEYVNSYGEPTKVGNRLLIKCECENIYDYLLDIPCLDINNDRVYPVIVRIAKILYLNDIKKQYVNSKYKNIYNVIPVETLKNLFLNVENEISLSKEEIENDFDNLFFVKNSQIMNIDSRYENYYQLVAHSIEDIDIPKPNFLVMKSSFIVFLDFEKYDEDTLIEVANRLEILKRGGYLPIISIKAIYKNFTDEEITTFINAKETLDALGYEIYFDGGYKDTYTLDELIKADKRLDLIIDKIKGSNLSPLEKYLYIYDYLTSKPYNVGTMEYDLDNPHSTRDIIAITNSSSIVCAGYAVLMYYLCKEVGIKCYTQLINVSNDEIPAPHMNNLVYIEDEKYGIDGLYYADACWDSVKEIGEESTYTLSLVHLDDKKFIGCIPMVTSDTALFYRDKEEAIYFYEHINRDIKLSLFSKDENEAKSESLLLELEDRDYYEALYKQAFDTASKKGIAAIEKLEALLKENNAPIDIFSSDYAYIGCTPELLIAYSALDYPVLDNYVKRAINIYNHLKGEDKPKINPLLLKFCTLSFDINKENYELLLHAMKEQYDAYYVGDIANVIFGIYIIGMTNDKLKEYKYSKPGENVSIDTYEKALKEVFTFEGVPEEEIEEKIKKRIALSKENSQYVFYENASNPFRKEDKEEKLFNFLK